MDTYFAKRDADYLPVPPLLVSTSGLESYLESLSRRLGRDIVEVKHQVEVSSRDVAEACLTVNKLRRFLATKAMTQMEGQLSDTFTNAEAMDEVERDFERALDGHDSAEQPDVFTGMLVIAKKLVKENEALKEALAANASVISSFTEQQRRATQALDTVNQRLQDQQRDFHQLSLWLGTYDASREQTTALASPLPSHDEAGSRTFESQPLRLPSEAEVDSYIANSPLFLSLRRMLLRDVSERVTSSSESQSKEVGDLVAQLKKEMSRQTNTERAGNAVEERRSNDSQALMEGMNKRLKEIESNYVRREQLMSSLKTKADTLLLPVKADTAEVSTLERRVFDKYADLEERVAFFEAEREEFRKTLHTILSLLPQQTTSQMLPDSSSCGPAPTTGGRRDTTQSSGRAREATTLRDALETVDRQGSAADNLWDPRVAARTHPNGSSNGPAASVDGKQVYRVIGANRTGFATSARAVPSDARGPLPASKQSTARSPSPPPKTVTGGTSSQEAHAHSSSSSPAVEAIGMTANQAAYAQFVTREMNRAHVESLPPLPYEKLQNSPS